MKTVSTPEFPRTDITRGADGNITQLDTYIPEVLPGEIQIGVDLAEFTKVHPIAGIDITHNVERLSGMASGTAELGDNSLPLEGDDILKITQHTGHIHPGGIAIVASLYSADLARHITSRMVSHLPPGR